MAFGKLVTLTESSASGVVDTADLTDGFSSTEDSICPSVAKASGSSPGYFEVDLQADYRVRSVSIHFKDSVNPENERVSLNNVLDCKRAKGRTQTLNVTYECLPFSDEVGAPAQNVRQRTGKQITQGNIIKLEHSNSFVLGVCEVQVFANPSNKKKSISNFTNSFSFFLFF